MSGEKVPRGFTRARSSAERILGDGAKTGKLLDDAAKKADRYKSKLLETWDDLLTLIKLVRAWKSGRYRDIPYKTIILIAAALFYFVNPFDIIPDVLPALGILDDAGVIMFVLNSVREDIARFRAWEEENGQVRSVKKERD